MLDNCEHLIEACAQLADALLRACPQVQILATSRAPLRLRAEREIPVPPLALPDPMRHEPVERVTQYEAVRFFIERAVAAKPDFKVDAENAPAVAEICHRLDGLPLAIELAAARIKLLPPQALRNRLEQRLPLLTAGARDAPARQRTLRDAIAWSHDLLSPDEQLLFRRLGVFAGGCTLEMAEAVVNPDGSLDVFSGLASLADESLLRQQEGPGSEPRFRMLETIREFALERLATSGEEDAVRGRLADWFLEQATEMSTAFETGFARVMGEVLEAEHANLNAVLGWLERTEQTEALQRLAGALGIFWFLSGRHGEGWEWLERALAKAPVTVTAERVRALCWAGPLAHWLGHSDIAADHLERSATLARQLGLSRYEAYAMDELGVIDVDRGNYDVAEARFIAAQELFREADAGIWVAMATYQLGIVAYGKGEAARARQLWEEALASPSVDDASLVAGWCLEYLALLAAEQGDLREAANTFHRLLDLDPTVARRHQDGALLRAVAVLSSACGLFETTARLLGAVAALPQGGGPEPLPERLAYDRAKARACAALGAEGYERACAEGGRWRPEDVADAVDVVLATAATAA